MVKKLRWRIVSFLMALTMLTTLGVTNVNAAEMENPVEGETSVGIETRAGTETFRLNKNYEVGSFTFEDSNTTLTKTVQGRYLYTYFKFSRASSDRGIASTPIVVTVDVLDANTRNIINTAKYYLNPNGSLDYGFETDLGYAGRKICYRFDASSYNGPTNGNFRSANVERFMVNTSNTQGMYWDQ